MVPLARSVRKTGTSSTKIPDIPQERGRGDVDGVDKVIFSEISASVALPKKAALGAEVAT
jgi:hypothetical protein